jgi:hypothetical protein
MGDAYNCGNSHLRKAVVIKLLDPKSKLPPLEMVLGGITKSFETETAA